MYVQQRIKLCLIEMTRICSGCNTQISDVLFMECCNKNCNKSYGLDCLGITIDQVNEEDKRQWICPECRSSTHKAVRNENTPTRRVSGLGDTVTTSNNVNTQRGSRQKIPEGTVPKTAQEPNMLEELRAFRLEVLSHLNIQGNNIKRIEEVCSSIKNELQELRDANMKVFEDKVVAMDTLHSELNRMKARNRQLEKQVDTYQSNDTSTLQQVSIETICDTEKVQCPPTRKIINPVVATKKVLTPRSEKYSEVLQPKGQTASTTSTDLETNAESKDETVPGASEWTMVQRKKSKLKSKNVNRGQNASILDLQAMERKRHLHVWRLHPETTLEKLTAHVKNICGRDQNVRVEKIQHKTERDYSSFIIGVAEGVYEKLYKPEVWPVNAEFAEWIWFRRYTNKRDNGK